MSVYTKAHYKALTTNMEQLNIAFILALAGDVLWAGSSLLDSYSGTLLLVTCTLVLSLAWSAMACYRYHMTKYSEVVSDMLSSNDLASRSYITGSSLEEIDVNYDAWVKMNSGKV